METVQHFTNLRVTVVQDALLLNSQGRVTMARMMGRASITPRHAPAQPTCLMEGHAQSSAAMSVQPTAQVVQVAT